MLQCVCAHYMNINFTVRKCITYKHTHIDVTSPITMKLPRKSATGITMKGFRVFVLIDPKGQSKAQG